MTSRRCRADHSLIRVPTHQCGLRSLPRAHHKHRRTHVCCATARRLDDGGCSHQTPQKYLTDEKPVGPDLSGKRPVHSLHFVIRNAAFPDKSGPHVGVCYATAPCQRHGEISYRKAVAQTPFGGRSMTGFQPPPTVLSRQLND